MSTFFFSDIEGSTALLQQLGSDFTTALADHHRILGDTIVAHGGTVERTEGDAFFATFSAASSAVQAAVTAQRVLGTHPWPGGAQLAVRIGLHTGEAVAVGRELVGLDVHRAARIMSAGWGGQIVVSATTAALLDPSDPDIVLRDLGAHRLKDLAEPEQLHQVVATGLRTQFPALRTLAAAPINLPKLRTNFVGRQREVAEIRALLGDRQLLTLTGPGGTGKTRLSLEVAAQSADDYPDGVFFVALAGVSDPDLVVSVIATTLGLTPAGGQTALEAVARHLDSRRALLVLDNFEQVLPAAADLSELLSAAPDVTLLVSSRAALHIAGEQEYPVPPLPLPDEGADAASIAASDAVALFVARAAAIVPGFSVDARNAAAIMQITRRLDGLPLAIELAAARVKLLPVEAIAARLSSTLDLLSGGARDLPDRQRTLRGAIAWSYELLDDPCRRLFGRCGVFRGGMNLEEIEAVCAAELGTDVFSGLGELVDHSLVRRVDVPDAVRFAMLETIREYAAECLERAGEADKVQHRHAEAYLRVAEEAAPYLTSEQAGTWLDRLERDHDNLRAALRWAMASDTAMALRLVAALWRLWQIRGHLNEGRRYADQVLTLTDAEHCPRELAAASEAAGSIAYWQGDLSGALAPYRRALDLYREFDDMAGVARATYNLGFSYGFDAPDDAHEVFTEALAAYEALGDELGTARAHWALMVASMWRRDYPSVREHGRHCLPVFRAAGVNFDLAWALHIQGMGEYALHDHAAAYDAFTECLQMFAASQDASGLYLVLADFAVLYEAAGDPARALRLFGAVQRLEEETGSGLLEPQLALYPRGPLADEQCDPATAAALRAEGYAMTRDEAVAHALSGAV